MILLFVVEFRRDICEMGVVNVKRAIFRVDEKRLSDVLFGLMFIGCSSVLDGVVDVLFSRGSYRGLCLI